MTKYEPIEGTENKFLKIEVFYNKGGMNYYNGKTEARGYWLSARQVERNTDSRGISMESFALFSGAKMFLMEVKRQSAKSYEQACKLAEPKIAEVCEAVLNNPQYK
jgi:hypothetical protein